MIDTDPTYPEAGEALKRIHLPPGPNYGPTPTGDYAVAYKQAMIKTAPWSLSGFSSTEDAAIEKARGLLRQSYIVYVAVFTATNWRNDRPTGLALLKWTRGENGEWVVWEGE